MPKIHFHFRHSNSCKFGKALEAQASKFAKTYRHPELIEILRAKRKKQLKYPELDGKEMLQTAMTLPLKR